MDDYLTAEGFFQDIRDAYVYHGSEAARQWMRRCGMSQRAVARLFRAACSPHGLRRKSRRAHKKGLKA